jgi:hypothetical protein
LRCSRFTIAYWLKRRQRQWHQWRQLRRRGRRQ